MSAIELWSEASGLGIREQSELLTPLLLPPELVGGQVIDERGAGGGTPGVEGGLDGEDAHVVSRASCPCRWIGGRAALQFGRRTHGQDARDTLNVSGSRRASHLEKIQLFVADARREIGAVDAGGVGVVVFGQDE